jgi:hypothetical protein
VQRVRQGVSKVWHSRTMPATKTSA